jgi:hypothetical protein
MSFLYLYTLRINNYGVLKSPNYYNQPIGCSWILHPYNQKIKFSEFYNFTINRYSVLKLLTVDCYLLKSMMYWIATKLESTELCCTWIATLLQKADKVYLDYLDAWIMSCKSRSKYWIESYRANRIPMQVSEYFEQCVNHALLRRVGICGMPRWQVFLQDICDSAVYYIWGSSLGMWT